ncbi:hypothetical protein QL285_063409 [Trifolium repens]|nr:hypothetical protein QL285_063409 [Trifolium repens]
MAPKRSRVASQSAPPRFLSSVTQRQHGIIGEKRLVQEIGIDIPVFDSVPRVREILLGYGWVPFNNMLGQCNKTIVEEFYANVMAFGPGDYRSYVRGVHVSFSRDTIDATFGFRPEGQCGVHMRRASWREGAITDAEYNQIRDTLDMPGKDWRYSRQAARQRLQATEMLPLAKLWAKWWTHNFEACSNETEIITSRCLGIYNILMEEPIQVGSVIAQSIKRTITSFDATMAATQYDMHVLIDWGLPRYSPHMMDAVQGYRAQHPLPSYRQQYPEQPDLTGHFNRETQNLLQHQQQVQDRWDQAGAEELAVELEDELASDDEGGH